MADDDTECHSIKGTARRLGISEATLERMIKRGEIKSIKVSPRRRIIPMREIKRILQLEIPA